MSVTKPLPASKQALIARPGTPGIDPRGPRFSAGITAVLLLVVIALALASTAVSAPTIGERAGQPAFILFAIITALFAWGALAGVSRHPYGWLFRTLVRPRLVAPTHLEDPRPPTFSQGVGLVVTLIGVVLHLAGVPFGLVIFAAAAFIAAFLNSVFDYCFGCQLYLLLVRAGLTGRKAGARA
ncbi:DUF4395 domain-containing protein [Glaciihabitans sp. INWT7]|uniref:DUF4395 domain-containing protein n=1 Tax=Glaciihabitans sp. INWT7 TaxID=2596912 RepID=UPI001626CFED|nr:DUF4395 domain-containing protein [Glaciihabitans sp. INWT7]QNE46543.1 DUF4395 domain-containing protein [Glaciihabitans sp. INWT7]